MYDFKEVKEIIENMSDEEFERAIVEAGIENCPLVNNVAVLAIPNESIIKIDSSKTQQFLEDSKKNTIKPEFLEKCQQSDNLLNKRKQERGFDL